MNYQEIINKAVLLSSLEERLDFLAASREVLLFQKNFSGASKVARMILTELKNERLYENETDEQQKEGV